MCAQSLGCVWLFAAPWTVACQASLSIEVSRQEYENGLAFPSPGDLHDSVINPSLLCLLHWQAVFYHCTIWEALSYRWPLLRFLYSSYQKFSLYIQKHTRIFFFGLNECIFCKFLCPFPFSLNISYIYFHINIYIVLYFHYLFMAFLGLCCCAKTVVVWL